MDKKVGNMDNKSINPYKLKAYFNGLLEQYNLNIYSIVKKIVRIHSNIYNSSPYFELMLGTDSTFTIRILRIMNTNSITSNVLPAGVSASKIISCILLRLSENVSFNL